VFTRVDVYGLEDGLLVHRGHVPEGDRGDGGIASVAISGGRLIVSRLDSEGAGACCPQRLRVEVWSLVNGVLAEDRAARKVGALPEAGPAGQTGCASPLDCELGQLCESGACRESGCHSGERSPRVAKKDCPRDEICVYEDSTAVDRDVGGCEARR